MATLNAFRSDHASRGATNRSRSQLESCTSASDVSVYPTVRIEPCTSLSPTPAEHDDEHIASELRRLGQAVQNIYILVAEEARAKLKEQLSADDTHSIIKFLDFIIKHVRELGINEARNLVAAEIQAYRDRGAGSPIFTVDIEFPGNPPETLPVIAQCDFMSSDPSELERLKGSLRATREECRPRFSEYEIDKACGILDRVFSLVLRIDPQETRRKIHVRLSEEKEPGPISDSQAESMVAGNG